MNRAVALLLSALTGAACAPLQSASALMDANRQLEAARTAGAVRLAPYTYASASLYLHKAREVMGTSSYDLAYEYAQKAFHLAAQAQQICLAADAETPPNPVTP